MIFKIVIITKCNYSQGFFMEISEQLKYIRKEKGLTQQEFAVLLEVSTPTIASVWKMVPGICLKLL